MNAGTSDFVGLARQAVDADDPFAPPAAPLAMPKQPLVHDRPELLRRALTLLWSAALGRRRSG